ncbi:hypothetical protein [Methylocystis sp. ATCC 49242]|uniref:hypothetical protein n=1 Tax=Methylocystis sp. ATCC 49242 TaxID=622637 RepID=UPI0001F888F1|nr:hypothetical protein [Methylocystis sp. ATCC 49242]
MDSSLLDRLQKLEFCMWENGERIASIRNPDGFEAAAVIRALEARIRDLEEEIATLDLLMEQARDPLPIPA